MSEKHNSLFLGIPGLLLLFILILATLVLVNGFVRGLRADLTEHNLFTLTDGSKNIASSIEEPVNLYFFFSDDATIDYPRLRLYGNRVREMLLEFVVASDAKLQLQIVDPQRFSEDEDRATQFGLQQVPVDGGDNLYFGLAATNSVGDQEVIPFFDPARENFLEYDIAKLISTLSIANKPVLGLMSSLSLSGGFDPNSGQSTQPWVTYQQLQQLYEIRVLGLTLDAIPDDIDLLMVVHPKNFSDTTLYALDQYMLSGGNTLLFLDPHAEVDIPPTDPNNPQAALFADRSSNLNKITDAWGVQINQVVLDDVNALRVGPNTRHLGIIGITEAGLSTDDVVVGDLDSINFSFAGSIAQAEESSVTLLPLVQSSEQSSAVPTDTVKFAPNPDMLRTNFKPAGNLLTVAARVGGTPDTAFPDGKPVSATPDEEPSEDTTGETESVHLTKAVDEGINVLLVADVDVLTDRLWANVQQFFGQTLIRPFANNGDFLTNAVDNYTGSSDLISIRGRAGFSRPFDRVEGLRRDADERFRQTEQQLQDQLQETENKLAELQANREDSSALILTEEQSLELQRFQDERLRIRKELRQVRRDLDKDIEDLGTTLKVGNILLMPLLVGLWGLLQFGRRNRRRRGAV